MAKTDTAQSEMSRAAGPGNTVRNDCAGSKQLSFPFLPEAPGKVWPVPGGRWHAELFGGWYVCVAASRKAAIEGVKRAYKAERERY